MKKVYLYFTLILIFGLNTSYALNIECIDFKNNKKRYVAKNFFICEYNFIENLCENKKKYVLDDYNNIVVYENNKTIAKEFFRKKGYNQTFKKTLFGFDTLNSQNSIYQFLIYIFGRYDLKPLEYEICTFE